MKKNSTRTAGMIQMGAEYLAFVMYTSQHLFSCSIGCDFELFQHEQFHGCHRHQIP